MAEQAAMEKAAAPVHTDSYRPSHDHAPCHDQEGRHMGFQMNDSALTMLISSPNIDHCRSRAKCGSALLEID
jgi:hypothetical protein